MGLVTSHWKSSEGKHCWTHANNNRKKRLVIDVKGNFTQPPQGVPELIVSGLFRPVKSGRRN
jgi:hypothetical protein